MKYSITFYTYWHCGSGLSGGSSNDALVVRDAEKLPFVPGKTVKGHLRDIATQLGLEPFITNCFGVEDSDMGACFFGDAVVEEKIEHSRYLYETLASTKIDEQIGVAVDDTLRSIEVVVPLTLYGEVLGCSEEMLETLSDLMARVKHIGMRRHRGLGRCDIKMEGA